MLVQLQVTRKADEQKEDGDDGDEREAPPLMDEKVRPGGEMALRSTGARGRDGST